MDFWVVTVTSKNMVDFVKEHIVYCFGIPQTITTDQGTMFTSEEFGDFAASMGIKCNTQKFYYKLVINSSLY